MANLVTIRAGFRQFPGWLLFAAAGIAIAAGGAEVAHAADPQAYRVEIASTGRDSLDNTIEATSELKSLQKSAPVSPFGLIMRARSDEDRLETVLESFGYYESTVSITIEGRKIKDPDLGEILSALPAQSQAGVSVKFTMGPLYHLRRIDIDGSLPDSVRGALGLAPGAPAAAAYVLAGGARLLTALQEQGYAFAQVDPPVAYEDRTLPLLDLKFHVAAGPRVKIGAIRFVGLQRVRASLVRSRLLLHTGERYSPDAIERARRDLLELGVFAAVSVQTGAAVDGRGGLPITFDVSERRRHAVSLNALYSSDLGGSGGVTWTNLNLFGRAERLSVSAAVTNIGGSAATGLGYNTGAKLLKPDFGHRDQTLQFAVTAVKQSLQAYQQKALTTGTSLIRKLSSTWSASLGITSASETIVQEGTTRGYTLVAIPFGLTYDSTNLSSPIDDPVHGMRDSLTVTPTHSIGATSATFLITQLQLAAYLDLHALVPVPAGRSVIAVRALAGLASGAGEYSLPPDQRFYGGGAGTIRGFRYQSVGPAFPNSGNPIGGTAITAGSIEFRQRFGKRFGAAVFVDGGKVSARSPPSLPVPLPALPPALPPPPNVFHVGAGTGIRYYTPIGAVRFDVAVPIKRYTAKDDRFEIYVGLGQAF